jgi:putative flippase GtrA
MGKFGVVGAVSYVVDVTVSNLLLASLGPYWATLISMTVAATVAFVGNRYWTWRDRERTGLHREYLLYFLFNLIGLGISLVCVWFCLHVLGAIWPSAFTGRLAFNIAKNVVGVGLGTMFRFWSYRRYVFAAAPARDQDPHRATPPTADPRPGR